MACNRHLTWSWYRSRIVLFSQRCSPFSTYGITHAYFFIFLRWNSPFHLHLHVLTSSYPRILTSSNQTVGPRTILVQPRWRNFFSLFHSARGTASAKISRTWSWRWCWHRCVAASALSWFPRRITIIFWHWSQSTHTWGCTVSNAICVRAFLPFLCAAPRVRDDVNYWQLVIVRPSRSPHIDTLSFDIPCDVPENVLHVFFPLSPLRLSLVFQPPSPHPSTLHLFPFMCWICTTTLIFLPQEVARYNFLFSGTVIRRSLSVASAPWILQQKEEIGKYKVYLRL